MELQHVNAKIPVHGPLTVDPARFIDTFHGWIQEGVLDELLIDVADYRHVPAGPGIVLVALEADYSMDHAGSLWGLRYNRKAPLAGDNQERLAQALRCASRACLLLEGSMGGDSGLQFSRTTFELFVNDRALAPNTAETYAACTPEFQAFLQRALGHGDVSLTRHDADTRARFGFTVQCARPFDLDRLSAE
jgi:hypothetical protein